MALAIDDTQACRATLPSLSHIVTEVEVSEPTSVPFDVVSVFMASSQHVGEPLAGIETRRRRFFRRNQVFHEDSGNQSQLSSHLLAAASQVPHEPVKKHPG